MNNKTFKNQLWIFKWADLHWFMTKKYIIDLTKWIYVKLKKAHSEEIWGKTNICELYKPIWFWGVIRIFLEFFFLLLSRWDLSMVLVVAIFRNTTHDRK
jgi:hypothetical protein